jgi:tungstate transport system ATP-binding protein
MLSVASLRRAPILPVTARGLVYEAGGRRLIDELDLDVPLGTLTAILGPNGAGKSLLLRLLHGLIAPTAGQVLFAGRPADAAIRRRQAMVFQKPVLLRRSVAANIDYTLRLTGQVMAVRRARRQELLALGNLTHLAETPARRLSGGEQQRLALVRALALEPDILFLDEPTASLDPAASLAVERLILTAHGTGTTIVLVTHDRAQAQRLADKVVLLHRGRVAERAATASFFAAPESEAGRAFLAGRFMV